MTAVILIILSSAITGCALLYGLAWLVDYFDRRKPRPETHEHVAEDFR